MPRIVRFRDLEQTWSTHRAREPGFMRWLVTWVGGPAGHINTNPGVAVESSNCAIGLMLLPRGQRQSGKHIHSVTEIYVVLEGLLEGFDASGHPHGAGPMDCTVIPPGCPHGVRNCGLDDVLLVWVHDDIEADGVSAYFPDDHPFADVPAIEVVRYADMMPDAPVPGARGPGTRPWSANWVAGLAGSPDPGEGVAVPNARVAVGITLLDPGHHIPAASLEVTRFYLVTEGEAIVDQQTGTATLTRLDGIQFPAGEPLALRNGGPCTLRLLWVDCPAD